MDNQSQQPAANSQQPTAQPVVKPNPEAITPQQVNRPELTVSDADVQALLAAHNLQSSNFQHKNSKSHIGLLITIVTVVILAIFASYALDSLKPNKNATSNSSNSTQSNSGSTNDSTTNQINQDVHSCSNLTNALSEC